MEREAANAYSYGKMAHKLEKRINELEIQIEDDAKNIETERENARKANLKTKSIRVELEESVRQKYCLLMFAFFINS